MSDKDNKNDILESTIHDEVENAGIVDVDITSEMKTSFLSYAMSVIVSRALPDVRDGLKPVHRRILYGMNELGVYSDKAYKKSARIVGDVIGKYHPHGESAVYEAMVRMAQDFSYRYPLVDGHGNFGSVDGDGAAAQRYTEARMSKLTSEMLRDLEKNTVNFLDNYDGSEREPEVLPARFPNLLVNGSSGIAVGMATNIPPHNLNEVVNATLALMKNPNLTVEELISYIPAPDFPTGGIIMGLSQVRKAYLSGSGTITIRAKVKIVKVGNKQEIIITEIPYQVNKTRLMERIAELAKQHVIEGITDFRDETSNKNGMKIVIELRKDANSKVILNNLYKHTQLQITYGINMIALDRGQPRVLNLKQILECYIEHQIEVITRRTIYDYDKAKARLHIVEGLLIALANIDEVIRIIKESKANEEAINRLMTAFVLTEIQSKAILDMRLQALTGLQVEKLQEENRKLLENIAYLEDILANAYRKIEVITQELEDIQKRFGDKRQSEIDTSSDLDVNDADLIPVEDVIITITNKGYVKRMGVDIYKAQRRGGKGITAAKMQGDDFVQHVIYTSSHDYLLFFSNLGKVYSLRAFEIPTYSRTAKGIPLVNLLNFDKDANEQLAAVINCSSIEQGGYLLFATKNGIIKKTELIQYRNIRSTGIRAITLAENDELMEVALTDGTANIILGASNGKAVRFSEELVRPTLRSASGVRGIKVAEGERLIGMVVSSNEDDEILIITSNGFGKRTKVDAFKEKGRNGKGVKFINITPKSGTPVCLHLVTGDDDLIVISDKGIVIRIPLEQISTIGRDTQGVKIITLNDNQMVASIAIVPKNENNDEEDDEIS